ncbi:transporter substrate-binding domain-containing protein [Bifidobacterium sp. ESL0732]|uniref:transporter substrate-binding domain-containing protein n=1 Tax=Bifidobacterium sp. ESL0732 TaxID=2983222 RepID=UPI0023F92B22|nr:transporter substrate-binding domain-containing protein [Bifidobacterium sp. ESL0732]WEV63436.1 transporter substrate-binding domain-containing protein [Bifidobacterium sp. ESL0732]
MFSHLKIRKITASIAVAASIVALSSACGQRGDASGQAQSGDAVKTVIVATSGRPAPMITVDKNGKLTGYEIELLKEANKLIPEYRFEYEKMDFEGVTAGIDSGKYQIGANFFNYTPERAEKFIFSKYPHYRDKAAVLAKPGFSATHHFNKLSDLGGYTVPVDPNGSAWQVFVEDFNKMFPSNPMKIEYTPADHATRLRQISQGQFDFGYGGRFHQKVYATDLGVNVEYIPIPDSAAQNTAQKKLLKSLQQETYFLFPKTDEGKKLSEAVDNALLKLHKNGKMQELSKHYLGFDMTGSNADWA